MYRTSVNRRRVSSGCATRSTERKKNNCAYENREEDARNVVIFATHVRETCRDRLPRACEVAELAGWKREGAGVHESRSYYGGS